MRVSGHSSQDKMQGRQVKRRRLRIKPENKQKKEEGKEEKQGFILAKTEAVPGSPQTHN